MDFLIFAFSRDFFFFFLFAQKCDESTATVMMTNPPPPPPPLAITLILSDGAYQHIFATQYWLMSILYSRVGGGAPPSCFPQSVDDAQRVALRCAI